jgi:hypothetical protein
MSTAAKISIQIDAQTALLQKGFAEARGQMQSFAGGMSGSVAAGMAKFHVGLAAVQGALASVKGAIVSVLGAMETMGSMDEMSTRLGMSADALTVLGYAAEQTGSSQEYMNTALEKMQNNLADAAAGGGAAQAAFAELGLSAKDLAGQPIDKVFAAIAEQMQGVGSSTDRTRLAMDIFGKAGGQLINLLAGGAEGLNAYGAEAESMGLLLGDARANVEAAGDSINKMKRAWGAFVQQVAILVAPALAKIAEALASIVGWFNRLMGHSTGATAPFKSYTSEAKKAAIHIDKTMRDTEKSAEKAATKIKQSWADIPKPADYTTPSIAAVTRGSAAGFTAVQDANRSRLDTERRHKDLTDWLARIYSRQKEGTLTLSPVDIT